MNRTDVKLYNVIFPIWFLLLAPWTWAIVLPANFVIDLLVVACTMKYLKIEGTKSKVKSVIAHVWILGFVADIAGGMLMMMVEHDIFGYDSALSDWWNDISYGVMYNPFDNVFSLLWVTICVVFTAVVIYFFNNMITLPKLNLPEEQRKKIALSLAIITAPYLFFLPTPWG